MSKKRTLHSFFGNAAAASSPVKKARTSMEASISLPTVKREQLADTKQIEDASDVDVEEALPPPATHPTYPFPIVSLSPLLFSTLSFSPYDPGKSITDGPDLNLLYYHPYIPPQASTPLFKYLRSSLPFYRVIYTIKRGSMETVINTPRYTTVFGLDATSTFSPTDSTTILDAQTKKSLPTKTYSCTPRPIPPALNTLRLLTEASTGETFNFCLVNYYASGSDSISYHSDDERFLGPEPAIASFSLGATRDFLLRHKPPAPTMAPSPEQEALRQAYAKPRKYELKSGDMLLMRGKTQERWLHSIPKRSGKGTEKGRINITFRKAMVRGGTENYYKYNVGTGPVYVWSEERQEMVLWGGQKGVKDCGEANEGESVKVQVVEKT
jgi:alkylated DNA repair dioxygenase AlkB